MVQGINTTKACGEEQHLKGVAVEQMIVESVEGLSPEEEHRMKELVYKFPRVFGIAAPNPGSRSKVEHTIETGEATPVKQSPRRLSLHRRSEAAKLVAEMANKGVITRADSPWASPIVLVDKKDGTTRFCIDYRRLNDVSRKDAYPVPHLQDAVGYI